MCHLQRSARLFRWIIGLISKKLKYNYISDSKRQQTTTVDNKRLIIGLFLKNGISLHKKQIIKSTRKWQRNRQSTPNINH